MTYQGMLLFKPLILVVMYLIGMTGVNGQERLTFTVTDFDTDPFDLSAKDAKYERFDGNGERYALIKVIATNPSDNLNDYNFNFGNMNHIVEDHEGVLWIYVQKNAKMVTITRKGYVPLNRYDLRTSLESGKNYVMTLSSEVEKVYLQMVQFNVKPLGSGAVIMVKRNSPDSREELLGYVDPAGSVAKNLELGTYTYKVLAANYITAEGQIILDNRNKTLVENIDLKPNYAEITFTVDSDAEIYVNDQLMGSGKWTGALNKGRYNVECRLANHRPSSQTIEVTENDNRTIELKTPEPITGILSIITNPLGAEISVDGKASGQTPQNLDLLVGKHELSIQKSGFKPIIRTVEISEDKTLDINLALTGVAHTVIESAPTSSKLYIDGKFKGQTPYTFTGEAGDYSLKLTAKGYNPVEQSVYLGDAAMLSFTLEKKDKNESVGTENDLAVSTNERTISTNTESNERGLEKLSSLHKTSFYAEAGIGIGRTMFASVGAGCYFKHFNVEIEYIYCFKSSPTVFWINSGSGTVYESSVYRANFNLSGKIGYGFSIGNRWIITPQIGGRYTKLSEKSKNNLFCVNGANSFALTAGAKVHYKINSLLGISLAPEYGVSIVKSEGYKILSEFGSTISRLIEGFSGKISIIMTF